MNEHFAVALMSLVIGLASLGLVALIAYRLIEHIIQTAAL